MSEQLDVQVLARPAQPGSAGPGGIPTPVPAAQSTLSSHAVSHPGLSQGLTARIERDFMPRWRDEWGGRFFAEGRVPGPQSIRLDGNDYLSIAGHPHIVSAQIEALRRHASFMVQSGIFQKSDSPVLRLERALAEWLQVQGVMLCQSGYAANLGLLQVIVEPDTPVYIDNLAHMSLWEGIRAARARPRPFRHNQPAHLARCIREHGPGVVVVDAVYSTTGALCPLAEIVEVAEQGGCMIVVDESHSLGTHGPQGQGLCVGQGLAHRVHFVTASLAKAFAGRAGFFTVPHALRPYLSLNSFPGVFSSCLLPYEALGLQATLAVVQRADAARQRLRAITNRMRGRLSALGYPVAHGTEQIIALEAGKESATLALRDALEQRDIFGAMFCAPATARDRAMVRLTLSAGLTDSELDQVEAVLAEMAPTLRPWEWEAARRQQLRAD